MGTRFPEEERREEVELRGQGWVGARVQEVSGSVEAEAKRALETASSV